MGPGTARTAAELLAEADRCYDSQDWNGAGLAYQQALAIAPDRAQSWYLLGNVREEQGRDDEAETCFERARTLDPSHAKAWNNLGGVRQRRGNVPGALDAFRSSIAADPDLAQPYLNLGRLHNELAEHA